jgi:hypothetical protein
MMIHPDGPCGRPELSIPLLGDWDIPGESAGVDQNTIHSAFARFQFPESMEVAFSPV